VKGGNRGGAKQGESEKEGLNAPGSDTFRKRKRKGSRDKSETTGGEGGVRFRVLKPGKKE